MGTHRSQYWKPVPRFAKSSISQAPSLHFSFMGHEQVPLAEGMRKCNPKGKELAPGKVLVLKYSEKTRDWKMHDSRTCPSKQKHGIKVFQMIAFTSSLRTNYWGEDNILSVSILQVTESLTVSISFHHFQFTSRASLCVLILREQVGTTVCTNSWTKQGSGEDNVHAAMKWGQCSAPKNKDKLLPINQWLDSPL